MKISTYERFISKINETDECWLWTASTTWNGYGRFRLEGRMVYAHRLAYEMWEGAVPDGLQIDHLCRVRNCVNPEHLEPVTQLENIRRGEGGAWERAKTHCPQGHPYDEENTRIYRGERKCRACRRIVNLRYWAKAATLEPVSPKKEKHGN